MKQFSHLHRPPDSPGPFPLYYPPPNPDQSSPIHPPVHIPLTGRKKKEIDR